jgi:hypothetical protein
MRSYIVFLLLIAMVGLLVVLVVRRDMTQHEVTTAAGRGDGRAADSPSTAEAGARGDAQAVGGGNAAGHDEPGPDTKARRASRTLMQRPLRVVGLGWELIAPAVVAYLSRSPPEPKRM